MKRAWLTAACVVLAVGTVQADTYKLAGDNTTVKFLGTKPGGKHEGGFKTVTGTATIDGTDVKTLKLEVEIDMNSTWSDNEMLTTHLKSPDFFGVKANPKSKFVSSKVESAGDKVTITGKLTLNGKTKELSFPATVKFAEGAIVVDSSFKINRSEWGMTYGQGKVDDPVSLSVAVKAKK